jgi:hypothetical protein
MSTTTQPPGWKQLSWRDRYRLVSGWIKRNGQLLANAVTVTLLFGAILFAYAKDPNVGPIQTPPQLASHVPKSTCPKAGHKSARSARRAKAGRSNAHRRR